MDRVGITPRFVEDRTACINIRALPLQLLLRRHPEWKQRPVAVVEEEKPQSPIVWVNSAASQVGIRSGMRYAAGLSLDRNLCAGTVSEEESQQALRQIHKLLSQFSPQVELREGEPGVFWVDASGLATLYGSLEDWAKQIHSHLYRLNLLATVVVGFSRFGSYAIAKSGDRVTVIPSAEVEEVYSHRVMLHHLHLDPGLRDRMEKLEIRTVGDLLELPEGSISRHFGQQAQTFYRFAAGELSLPLQPRAIREPLRAQMDLEEPESNALRLLFLIKQLLDPLLSGLADRQQAVAALQLRFLLEDGDRCSQLLKPARPTLKVSILLDLIRLRLERMSFRVRPVAVQIEVEGVCAPPEALNLIERNPRRNAEAGLRALARVRAEFGPDSVVSVHLRSGHLPEARSGWRPFERPVAARPRTIPMRPLVRRAHVRPRRLEKAIQDCKESLMLGRFLGYLISGGWWSREVQRDYRFVTTDQGETLWVYFDQRRRRWYAQGRVE